MWQYLRLRSRRVGVSRHLRFVRVHVRSDPCVWQWLHDGQHELHLFGNGRHFLTLHLRADAVRRELELRRPPYELHRRAALHRHARVHERHARMQHDLSMRR